MLKSLPYIFTYFDLYKKHRQQSAFIERYFQEKSPLFEQGISKKFRFKLKYYALWGVVGINDCFATIRKNPLNSTEKRMTTEMSLFYALQDEWMDNGELNIKTFDDVFDENLSRNPLFKYTQQLIQTFKSNNTIEPLFYAAIQAQVNSIQQTQLSTIDDIRQITYKKGSLTMLLYRYLLENTINDVEADCIKQIGYTLQLADDIIDAYDDSIEKINTTSNVITLNEVDEYFKEQIKKSKTLYFQYYGNSKTTQKAFRVFQIMFAISSMALDQFQKNGVTTFKDLDFEKYQRKDFIMDMENYRFVLKSLRYCVNQ